MKGKNIWIINEYAGSPYHGMEFRHYYLAKEWIKMGYDVTIISASYSHLFKTLPDVKNTFTLQNIDGINYLWIKVPQYPSSHSLKRVIKWFWYTILLFFLPVRKMTKPDFIIVSPMQTMPILPALKWAKKFGSKVIFEVKDIWPLSVIELGGYSPSHPFIKGLKYFEKMAITKSDVIVSVLPNYGQYLKDEGYDKSFEYIPNGIDTEIMKHSEPLDEQISHLIPENKFIVGYAGTIGKANALHYLIESAKILSQSPDIAFVIVGGGSEKEALIRQASDLKNIYFLPPLPKKQVQNLLEKFDVCYIGLEKKHLFHYGVSPNKLFDYMYAARPIIFAIDSPNNVVQQAQCGIIVQDSADSNEIAKAIIEMYQLPVQKRIEMGNNGKDFVIKHHTYTALAEKYHNLFQFL